MASRTALGFGLALLLTSTTLAAPDTQIVSYEVDGMKVVGTLVTPEGDPAPVVLLFHGFGGSRDELEIPSVGKGIFTYTADKLAAEGIASLRIDFRNSGESDGEFPDTTYSGQIADGLAALDFVKTLDSVDADNIGIIGWSQGGLVASAVAGRSNVPKVTALWAAVADPKQTFDTLLTPEKVQAGLTTGDTPLELPMPWGFSLFLKQGYFEEIATTKPTEEIAAYKGALFVAEGTKDEAVAYGGGQLFIDAHEGDEEHFVRDMDHSFNVFTDTTTLDEMLASTVAFMKPYLGK